VNKKRGKKNIESTNAAGHSKIGKKRYECGRDRKYKTFPQNDKVPEDNESQTLT